MYRKMYAKMTVYFQNRKNRMQTVCLLVKRERVMPMSIMEVLTVLLVIFAALSYIDNKHNKNSIPPSKVRCYFLFHLTEGIRFCI